MASFNAYFGNSTQQDFALTFPYLDRAHVKVALDTVNTTAWTWFNASTVRLTTAPANGVRVRVYRETPVAPLVDYQGGAFLSEEALDISNRQAVYLAEEALDISKPLGTDIENISVYVGQAETARDAATAQANLADADRIATAADRTAVNAALAALQTQRRVVISRLAVPPASPATGASHIVIATATGAWAGQEGRIATWSGSSWVFTVASAGWGAYVTGENVAYDFDGTNWNIPTSTPVIPDNSIASVKLVNATVANAKLANMVTQSIKGRTTAATGVPEDLTMDQVRTMLRTGVRSLTSANTVGERTFVPSDIGKLIIFGGTAVFTMTFNAATTLGNGWFVDVKTNGNTLVTLDPSGSETIDGVTTLVLARGQECRIVCDGTGFHTVDLNRRIVLFDNTETASVPDVQVEIPAGYRRLALTAYIRTPADVGVLVQLSNNGGTTWATTGYLGTQLYGTSTAATGAAASAVNGLQLNYGGATLPCDSAGMLYLDDIVNGNRLTATYNYYTTAAVTGTFSSIFNGTLAGVNRIRLIGASGNLSAGTRFSVEGLR